MGSTITAKFIPGFVQLLNFRLESSVLLCGSITERVAHSDFLCGIHNADIDSTTDVIMLFMDLVWLKYLWSRGFQHMVYFK